jgi:hypothetical protein
MFKPNRFVSITAPRVTYAEPPPLPEPETSSDYYAQPVPERSNSRFPGEKLLKKLNKQQSKSNLNVNHLETALERLLREF